MIVQNIFIEKIDVFGFDDLTVFHKYNDLCCFIVLFSFCPTVGFIWFDQFPKE